ncbi:MAG: hypothetical protein OSJ46_01785 [Duncaniella sp.]|nr:hypothetical protein [Duncaniella sp.]
MKPDRHTPIPGTRPLTPMEMNCLHFKSNHSVIPPRLSAAVPTPHDTKTGPTPADIKVNL